MSSFNNYNNNFRVKKIMYQKQKYLNTIKRNLDCNSNISISGNQNIFNNNDNSNISITDNQDIFNNNNDIQY